MIYERNKVRVELHSIGEGLNGDFDPTDPEDIELLRFDVYRQEYGGWEPVDDASYCTKLPASSSSAIKFMVVDFIYHAIAEEVRAGLPVSRKCQDLSHLPDLPSFVLTKAE